MRSRAGRENTTRNIRENVQQHNIDHDILAFLRRTDHFNDTLMDLDGTTLAQICCINSLCFVDNKKC